jgi:hypothetical protein
MLWQDEIFDFITMRCTKSNQHERRVGMQGIGFRLEGQKNKYIYLYLYHLFYLSFDLSDR